MFTSVVLGNIVYILEQPIGIALVVMVPSVIIIILQIFRIVGVFSAERRKKQEAREAEKNTEIESLKKRLADLMEERTTPMETRSEAPMSEDELSKIKKDGTMSEASASENGKTPSEPPVTKNGGTMSESAPLESSDTRISAETARGAHENFGSDGAPPVDKSQKEE